MHPLYIPAPYQDSAEFGRLILRDGSTATVRVATLDDAPAVVALFHRLSPESRQHRFFSLSEPTPEFVRSLCDSSNPRRQLTLVITRTSGKNDAIIAAGSYIARDDKSAEVAKAVAWSLIFPFSRPNPAYNCRKCGIVFLLRLRCAGFSNQELLPSPALREIHPVSATGFSRHLC